MTLTFKIAFRFKAKNTLGTGEHLPMYALPLTDSVLGSGYQANNVEGPIVSMAR
jgi:hypothetical protein